MIQLKKQHIELGLKILGFAAAVVLLPEAAHATGQIADVAGHLASNTGSVTPVISAASYVGGTAMCAIGAMKLKDHTANPDNAKLSAGVGRMAVGAGLLALPSVMDIMVSSTVGTSGDVANAQYHKITGVNNN